MPNQAPEPKPKGRKKRSLEAERDLADPAVQNWFSNLSAGSVATYSEHFPPWMQWLRTQNGFHGITPSELLNRQFKNKGKPPTEKNHTPEFEIVDMLKKWIGSLPDRYSTKVTKRATVESFFKRNRCQLPKDDTFTIYSDKEPTLEKLTFDHIKQITTAAHLRDKSHMLVRLQGIMDTSAVDYVNRNLGGHIVSEIRAGKDVICLDLPGRKRGKNVRRFYTFIGKDAIDALREYFDKERKGGYPKTGEPIWLNKLGQPYAKSMYGDNYLKLLRMQGLIPRPNGRLDSRFGMHLHEWRDQVITHIHTYAKRHGFDMDVAQFLSGHAKGLDKNKYDKFMNDKPYVEEQYRIAEPFLNIVSQSNDIIRSKVEELDAKLADVEKKVARGDSRETLIEAIKELRNTVAARWLMGSRSGTMGLAMPPPELRELDEILATLENPKSSTLDVYKAQKRFDKLAATE
jgi:integrase